MPWAATGSVYTPQGGDLGLIGGSTEDYTDDVSFVDFVEDSRSMYTIL